MHIDIYVSLREREKLILNLMPGITSRRKQKWYREEKAVTKVGIIKQVVSFAEEIWGSM